MKERKYIKYISIIACMHVGYLGKSSIVASKEEDWVGDRDTEERRRHNTGDSVSCFSFSFFFLTFIILTYVPVILIEESTNLR